MATRIAILAGDETSDFALLFTEERATVEFEVVSVLIT